MGNHRNRFPARRRFLKQSTVLTATVVALPLPQLARAGTEQPADASRVSSRRRRRDQKR